MTFISFSESSRPKESIVMINKKSFILKIDSSGLRKTDTVCPQDHVEYDLIDEHLCGRPRHYVKIVGVDLI